MSAARVAVVTGGGSGLGEALAEELVRRGHVVVVADLVEERAHEVAQRLGAQATGRRVDVRVMAEVEGLRDATLAQHGRIDLWVNNAGVAVAGQVGDVALDDWRWVVEVNLWGVVHGCHAIVPHFKQQGSGRLLNVASAAGLMATPAMGPYNVTKAGVVSLSETLYGELSPLGLGVTVLCPTFFQTRLLETARSPDPSRTAVAARLMRKSRYLAADVARAALDDVERGRLYSVPMADGRLLWTIRRLAPQRFHDLMPKVVRWLEGKKRTA